MTMHRWRVSGEHSSRSLFITAIIKAGRRQGRTLRSILMFSTIDSADKQSWGSYPLLRIDKSSMLGNWQQECFGIHFFQAVAQIPIKLGKRIAHKREALL